MQSSVFEFVDDALAFSFTSAIVATKRTRLESLENFFGATNYKQGEFEFFCRLVERVSEMSNLRDFFQTKFSSIFEGSGKVLSN